MKPRTIQPFFKLKCTTHECPEDIQRRMSSTFGCVLEFNDYDGEFVALDGDIFGYQIHIHFTPLEAQKNHRYVLTGMPSVKVPRDIRGEYIDFGDYMVLVFEHHGFEGWEAIHLPPELM